MKIKATLLALAALFTITACNNTCEQTHDAAVLPAGADKLISEYFPGTKVSDTEFDSRLRDFDVLLSDGTQLEFDRDGKLIEADCHKSTEHVPDGLIRPDILAYMNDSFHGEDIVSYEVRADGYEVGLHSGFNLFFDKSGHYTRLII